MYNEHNLIIVSVPPTFWDLILFAGMNNNCVYVFKSIPPLMVFLPQKFFSVLFLQVFFIHFILGLVLYEI